MILQESDTRSKLQKMKDLANHPTTPIPIRDMALRKIKEFGEDDITKPLTQKIHTVTTNVSKNDFNNFYAAGI